MKNKFNFSRRNPKTKKIENTGFMEFRNVSNNAADLYIYGESEYHMIADQEYQKALNEKLGG